MLAVRWTSPKPWQGGVGGCPTVPCPLRWAASPSVTGKLDGSAALLIGDIDVYGILLCINSLIFDQFIAHAIFDVIIDNEVKFLVSEAVMLGKNFVDFVNDGF